ADTPASIAVTIPATARPITPRLIPFPSPRLDGRAAIEPHFGPPRHPDFRRWSVPGMAGLGRPAVVQPPNGADPGDCRMSTRSTFHPSFVWISSISARRTSVRGVSEALFVTVSSTTPNTEAVVPSIDSTNTERTLPALVAWADLIAATVWAPKNCLTCPAKSPTAYDLIRAASAESVAALKFASAVRKVLVWATTSARRRSSDWARCHSEANSTAAASARTNSFHGTASHRPERR